MQQILHGAAILAATLTACFAQRTPDASGTSTNPVAELLVVTADFLSNLSSNATGAVRGCLTNTALTTNDYVELRRVLSGLRGELARADVPTVLSNASVRLHNALASAASASTDPADQGILLDGLSEQEFRAQIEAQRARAAFLSDDLDGAIRALEASLRVATPLQDVLTPVELGRRLGARLQGLLADWERAGPKSGNGPADLNASSSLEPPVQADAPQGSPAPGRVGGLPPQVAKVAGMVAARVHNRAILKFIESCNTPFGLATADQIIQARQAGLSDKLIIAMLQRDRVLCGRGREAERHSPSQWSSSTPPQFVYPGIPYLESRSISWTLW